MKIFSVKCCYLKTKQNHFLKRDVMLFLGKKGLFIPIGRVNCPGSYQIVWNMLYSLQLNRIHLVVEIL